MWKTVNAPVERRFADELRVPCRRSGENRAGHGCEHSLGKPRCSSIFRATRRSSISAIAVMRPPQSGHASTFALGMDASARERGDVELSRATLYPLGSLARRVEASEPWIAELVHARIVGALEDAKDVEVVACPKGVHANDGC